MRYPFFVIYTSFISSGAMAAAPECKLSLEVQKTAGVPAPLQCISPSHLTEKIDPNQPQPIRPFHVYATPEGKIMLSPTQVAKLADPFCGVIKASGSYIRQQGPDEIKYQCKKGKLEGRLEYRDPNKRLRRLEMYRNGLRLRVDSFDNGELVSRVDY